MVDDTLLLDSSIRDWVVLPLLMLMVGTGLLRHYVSILLRPTSGKPTGTVEHRVKSALVRCARFRQGGGSSNNLASRSKWEGRKSYWSNPTNGYLKEEAEWVKEEEESLLAESAGSGSGSSEAGNGGNMMNPMAMMDGMKGNMVFMVQNMVMMQGISYFFQGYILVKVPFPLTLGFKLMFQRGLDPGTLLDTSYVSSVSWYFLVMFGLRAFFRLAIDGQPQEVEEGTRRLVDDYGLAALMNAPGGANFDAKKALQSEMEHLEFIRYDKGGGVVEDAEKRLLGNRYSKRKKTTFSSEGKNANDDIFGIAATTGNRKSTRKHHLTTK